MNTTTHDTTTPVPLPPGAHVASDWNEVSRRGNERWLNGADRRVADVLVFTFVAQYRDGTLSDPEVNIDGVKCTTAEARRVAAAILEAADEVDGWLTR